MSNRKSARKKKGGAKAQPASAAGTSMLSRRNLIKGAVVVAGGGFAIAGIQAYDENNRTLHDLTVVGNGTPAVVQIHDPGCRLCRRLKGATEKALEDIDGVNYRLADITTPEGKAVQDRFGVPHVTLLYFDGEGQHRHTTNGTLSAEEVAQNIRDALK